MPTKTIVQYKVRSTTALVQKLVAAEGSTIINQTRKFTAPIYRNTELEKWYTVYTFTVAGSPNFVAYANFGITLDEDSFIYETPKRGRPAKLSSKAKKVKTYKVRTTLAIAKEMCRYEGSKIISRRAKSCREIFVGTRLEKDQSVFTFTIQGQPNVARWQSFCVKLDENQFTY